MNKDFFKGLSLEEKKDLLNYYKDSAYYYKLTSYGAGVGSLIIEYLLIYNEVKLFLNTRTLDLNKDLLLGVGVTLGINLFSCVGFGLKAENDFDKVLVLEKEIKNKDIN